MTVTNCIVANNKCTGGAGGVSGKGGPGEGGGIYNNSGVLVVTGTRVVANQATGGAGMIGGNAEGGGIVSGVEFDFPATVAIDHVIVANNISRGGAGTSVAGDGSGGGIFLEDTDAAIMNTHVLGNSAIGGVGPMAGAGVGGGVYLDDCTGFFAN